MADYVDWRDLLDADAEPATPASAPMPGVDAPADTAGAAMGAELPPALQALLAEKARLEDELKAMSGRGKPKPEDPRDALRFPVKVHTRDSRIEDRRLARHDEHARLLAQRAGERAALAQRNELRRQEEREAEAAERRREWVQGRIAAIAAAEAEARAELEARARAAADAKIRGRWAEQRSAATASHAAEAERAAAWQRTRQATRAAATVVRAGELRRAEAWQESRHLERAAATLARVQARDREQTEQQARAEQARAGRVAAARELVQARRREARATERHLDDRNRRK